MKKKIITKKGTEFSFDEELALKVFSPDKSYRELAAMIGVSSSYLAKWYKDRGMQTDIAKRNQAILEQKAENNPPQKREKRKSLSQEAREATQMKMTYGQYKAMQYEQKRKERMQMLRLGRMGW